MAKIACDLEENNYDEKLVELDKLIVDLSPKKEKLERELQSIESFKEFSKTKENILNASRDLSIESAKLKKELLELEPRVNRVSNLLEVSSMLKIESSNLDSDIKTRKTQLNKKREFDLLSEEERQKKKDLIELRASLKDLEETHQSSLSSQYEDVLAKLRADLKEGESCVLCGSKEHDLSALSSRDLLPNDEVKNIENQLSKFKKEESEIEKRLISLGAKLELLNTDLASLDSSNIEVDLEKKRLKLDRKIDENKKKIEEARSIDEVFSKKTEELSVNTLKLATLKERKLSADQKIEMLELSQNLIENEQEYRTKLSRFEEELSKALKSKDDCIETKSKLETRKLELKGFCEELGSEIESTSKEVTKLTSDLRLKLEEFMLDDEKISNALSRQGDLDSLKAKILEFDNELYRLNARKEAILASKDENSYDLELINRELDKARADLKKHTEGTGLFVEKLANLTQVYDKIQGKEKILGDARHKIAELKKLYDVINGKNKSMGLHRWILASVLDEILLRASEVLEQFMPSRYRLIRQGVADDKAISLEVEVIDLITGKNRKIKTLSGGEGFIVSLAFSLGLALVISDKRSFFDIEALFIDEGFGSLDSENLIFVLNVLRKMSDGKKMIGLITHVDMVKEFVSKSINVVPSSKVGSSLTFS